MEVGRRKKEEGGARRRSKKEEKKTGRLKLRYFLQSAEADFVFVDAVSTVRPIQ